MNVVKASSTLICDFEFIAPRMFRMIRPRTMEWSIRWSLFGVLSEDSARLEEAAMGTHCVMIDFMIVYGIE